MSRRKIKEAVELYSKFHWGKLPERAENVKIRVPDTFVYLGKLLGIIYLSDKDGSPKPYVHFFGKGEPFRLSCIEGEVYLEKTKRVSLSQLPDLLTDNRGGELYIVGFKGKVEERGIVG